MKTKITIAALVIAGGLFAAPGFAQAKGGTIKGKVSATPAKYLKDTVVYVKQVSGSFAPRTKTEDQEGMKFSPHILTITAGDSVKFLNHDHVSHNVMSPDAGFNLGMWGFNGSKTQTFSQDGHLHPPVWRAPGDARIRLRRAEPVRGGGQARMGRSPSANVPPGTYEIDVWNSHLKASVAKGHREGRGQE